MKMAKASQEDIEMTLELCRSLEDLEKGYLPAALSGEDEELPIWYDEEEDGDRVVQHLLAILRKGSAFRVAFGMAVMLDPANALVDPDADTIEHHPDRQRFVAAQTARPIAEYNDDDGCVLWWALPISEPPYVGQPSYDDWPGYHTHWTPLIVPHAPVQEVPQGEARP